VIAWVVGASGVWGGAVSRNLLGRGYDILALGRRDVPELAQEARRLSRSWSFASLDLERLDTAGAASTVAELTPRGAPDVLVLCATVTGRDRETMTRADFFVPAALIESVAARMGERGSGRIGVFIAQNARLGMAGLGDYSGGQGALWTWCEAFQGELAAQPTGVSLTRAIPPHAASATQRWVTERGGHTARLHEPKAGRLVDAILAGKRRAGRRPWLAALATLLR
jgi:short-subunit dehydrogenase